MRFSPALIRSLLMLICLSGSTLSAHAETAASAPAATAGKAPTTTAAPKAPSLETQFANLTRQSNAQTTRLNQLETANRDALTRNQALQLENDNLTVQVKVLQSDRAAQMFIYGAVTIVVGGLLGYIIAGYVIRRNRRW